MERTENDPLLTNENDDNFNSIHWLWTHISSQLIYFILFQYANFSNIVATIHEKVCIFIFILYLMLLLVFLFNCIDLNIFNT